MRSLALVCLFFSLCFAKDVTLVQNRELNPQSFGLPLGAIMTWTKAEDPDPDVWIECDGREIDPVKFPKLRAMASHTPNYLERFLRGGTKENVGEQQEDAVEWHRFYFGDRVKYSRRHQYIPMQNRVSYTHDDNYIDIFSFDSNKLKHFDYLLVDKKNKLSLEDSLKLSTLRKKFFKSPNDINQYFYNQKEKMFLFYNLPTDKYFHSLPVEYLDNNILDYINNSFIKLLKQNNGEYIYKHFYNEVIDIDGSELPKIQYTTQFYRGHPNNTETHPEFEYTRFFIKGV